MNNKSREKCGYDEKWLYEVTLRVPMMVHARNLKEAEALAKKHAKEELENFYFQKKQPETEVSALKGRLPRGWGSAPPYSTEDWEDWQEPCGWLKKLDGLRPEGLSE